MIPITYQGITYPSTEHAYQATKTISQVDRVAMANLPTAREARRFGQQIQMRYGWESLKLSTMEDVLNIKFQDPELRQKLIDTGDLELIEGNTWGDTFWGVYNGKGENHLGKILMKIRKQLR